MHYESRRVVIFGKTYPELSTKHTETVCTGGIDVETGRPVRLYPVPLRYLNDGANYRLYEEIRVPVRKSESDPRPESFKVDAPRIERLRRIDTAHNWEERRALVFRNPAWHFPTMAALNAANVTADVSMGMVRPGKIDEVQLTAKPAEERAVYARKTAELRAMKESDLFDPTYKELEYLPNHIRLLWRCEERCVTCVKRPHRMKVLDWGLLELGRRDGWEKAVSRLESYADQQVYDFRLFLGNFRLHPRNFGVIGLWYPKIPAQVSLF